MDQDLLHLINRRAFLNRSAQSLGAVALGSLMDPVRAMAATPGSIRHHAARAKHVIHLCMAGGASHLETFDYKPVLAKYDGQPMPDSYTKGKPIAQLQGKALKVLGPQHEFAKHGRGGVEVSSILPQIASVADEICVIRSLSTDQINHDPAHTVFNTGTSLPGATEHGFLGELCDRERLRGLAGIRGDDLGGRGGKSQPIASRQWA